METNDTAGNTPARTDTELLDWLLPFLDDSDIKDSIDREARLQGALQAGLKGRAALNAAMDAVLVERDTPEAIAASRERAQRQDVEAVRRYLLDTTRSTGDAARYFNLTHDNILEIVKAAAISPCDGCGHWCYDASLASDGDNAMLCLNCSAACAS